MKKVMKFVVFSAIVVLSVGCTDEKVRAIDGFDKRYLHNTTEQDLTIVCSRQEGYYIYEQHYDSVVVKPDEYYLFEKFQCTENRATPETVFYYGQMYIYMDGVGYQVDRNDLSGCLWLSSFKQNPSDAPASLRDRKFDDIHIFDLTEKYIRAQIPM